ncbi:hypothetical protein DM298_04295 [Lactobacillus amylovorus]|uniref:Uncharacterized protein n=1 Tax=Lactobacillus amylovorus TaxID=1604 RepID=A0A5B8ECZ6_LACAM|nr:hypothetical protein [Lactobacillus amylovorus]QDD70182.1 hypothetical protein DM298_04295 [Lactobacillus amylovorus]
MKDNVINAVFDFTHRINDDGNYRVSFEFRADTKDIDISIATKQYRSVIDILIENHKVSAYMHGQGVVNGQQIASLIWLLNEVDLFVNKVDQMLDKEKR